MMTDELHSNPLDDILHDYLLLASSGQIDVEYAIILADNGVDTNPDHYIEYSTCYGNFTHYRHIDTGMEV